MRDNREVFEELVRSGKLALQRGPIFDYPPGPMAPGLDMGRVEGMLLGLAIGDALGNRTESMLPAEREAQFGEIRDYLPNPHAQGRPVGLPSDDTQLAFWTLEQLLDDGRLIPERLARIFSSRRIFGIGSAMKQFLRNHKSGVPWYEAGARSAGNGALMRIAPVLIPHLTSGTTDLWADVALAAAMTHNDPGSTAACIAFTSILWQLLTMDECPAPMWWVEEYVRVAREIEGGTEYSTRSASVPDYTGPIWRLVEERVPPAWAERKSAREAGDLWHSGAYLLETVPTVLHILMSHGEDPEEAIVRAVNDTWDNDTIAAIVGAAVGALHGRKAFPEPWVAGLLGRAMADDDGRVFHLLEEARNAHGAIAALKACLADVEVGAGLQARGLTVFPLFRRASGTTAYLTMDQAPAIDQVEVTEVDAGGSVPELKLINRADEMVLLVEGDQLVGAKQNRTVNTTLLVAANSELTIPVSCVEAGRWHAVSDRLQASARYCHPSLRREKVRSVHASLRRGGGYLSDQQAVWAEVDRAAASVGARSATRDYEAVHDAVEQELGDLAEQVQLPEGAVGVAVAIGGRVELIELFGRPETLQRLWGKLARGYGLEAVERQRDTQAARNPVADDVRALLQRVATEGAIESYPSPGLGRDLRVEAAGFSGAALVAQGELVHCAVFSTKPLG